MSWIRIDDQFYDHPKWASAPGDSIALWLAAMAWCNRNQSFDGYVPAHKLRGLVKVRSTKATISDLISRGVFYEHADGYLIHEYATWQQNEKVKAIREKRSQAGKMGAAARWSAKANGKANEWQVPCQIDGIENAPPPTTHVETTVTTQPPPPTDGVLLGGGGNQIALEVAARLFDQEPAGSIKNRAGWQFRVAQRILIEHADTIRDALTHQATPEQVIIRIVTAERSHPSAQTESHDPAHSQAGAEYGRAVAQSHIDGNMIDPESFVDELAGMNPLFHAAASDAYRESVDAHHVAIRTAHFDSPGLRVVGGTTTAG